jgi:hypothetical protein
MSLIGTTSGLWLVGAGSFLAALPRLIRAPRPERSFPNALMVFTDVAAGAWRDAVNAASMRVVVKIGS